ncbi:unnamed protein product, partial [Prorocentrum cordatum]
AVQATSSCWPCRPARRTAARSAVRAACSPSGRTATGSWASGTDFVSSATPKPVAALQSRPIVQVCCGGQHSLARTATGLLWAWGCNEHGQLGLGDSRTRFRPEQVKALRVSRCLDVAAGSRHTLALSERGLVFACGAGSSGQLGSGGNAECEATPRVVDALREVGQCLRVACGHSHSLALVRDEDSLREHVYCWGLGSSGQLGVPREGLQERKHALLPQRLRLGPHLRVVDVVSGPLSHHSFLLVAPAAPASPASGSGRAGGGLPRHSLRTAIDADELLGDLRRVAQGSGEGAQMRALVKAVGSAFSSASVLNASFRAGGVGAGGARRLAVPTEADSGVDLLKVRRAYSTLVFELRSPELTAMLGRATLSICDELSKKRNLCVFLVVFENPLLLGEFRTEFFPGFHLALQRLTAAVLSLPRDSQRLLFGWLKHLPSEYFGRIVDVMQQYVTFVLTQPGQNKADASAAVQVLNTLWESNVEMEGILPERCFHNLAISQSEDLPEHYRQWQQQQSLVFSYCRYPFLLDAGAKRRLLSFDARLRMESAMQEMGASNRGGLPPEATLEQLLHFRVRRAQLLADFCGQLWWRLRHRPECLRLALSVEFVGELGVDAGGLRKECLQLVLRQIYERSSLLVELEELPGLVWFSPTPDHWRRGSPLHDQEEGAGCLEELCDPGWAEHLPEVAGAIVGLAAYNGIYLDLRIHPLLYRFLVQRSVSAGMDELRLVHPTLHRSLASLGGTSDASALGLTWRVRLPGSEEDFDLSRGAGDPDAPVGAADLGRFAAAYAEAALLGGARAQVEAFVQAALRCMDGPSLALCTAHDLELLLRG